MLDKIQRILALCDTEQRVMPPTALYNEGWLLRLALDWFSFHPGIDHILSVPNDATWYSEVLLASPFLTRVRGDRLAESYTHADAVIGQFAIGNSGRGDLVLLENTRHFVVVEAKLHSKLSTGTKNAPGYDQAARNVACMAHILSIIGTPPDMLNRLGFIVLAPESQISRGTFEQQLSRDSLYAKVKARVAAYNDPQRELWFTDWFLPMLKRMQVVAISWEAIADVIGTSDPDTATGFRAFYEQCLVYNGLVKTGPPS